MTFPQPNQQRFKRGLEIAWRLLLMVLLTVSPVQARDLLQSFLLAAKANDLRFLQQMPEMGLGPQTRDGLKNNLLMIALREGGEELAIAMLQQPAWQDKATLEYQNQLGETALMIASIKGSAKAAEQLIRLGAEVNRAGWTPLHYAASSGHVELIRLLAEHHAYLDAASPNATTPLMMATRFNHRPAAAELIRLGADPTLTNQSGFNARDYAKEQNNSDLAFWLELEEISFINKHLRRLPQVDKDATLTEAVIQSGGEVVTVSPSSGANSGGQQTSVGTEGSALVDRLPAVQPARDVEVLPGIR